MLVVLTETYYNKVNIICFCFVPLSPCAVEGTCKMILFNYVSTNCIEALYYIKTNKKLAN